MKKFLFAVAGSMFFTVAFAQDTLSPVTTPNKKITLPSRAGDHLMIQLSSDHWTGMPETIDSHQSGFSKGFNMYFMFNKPFKTSPKLSLGIGLGVGTSNIIFKKMEVDLASTQGELPFIPLDSADHFKKYKLSTGYLEVPLEFRFTAKPDKPGKSFKAAIGLKAGTIINSHTKGKNLLDKNGQSLNLYTQKENSKRFINGTRFMATARIGYGIFSLFGSYQLNKVLKDGVGPDLRLYQIGLTLSGL